MGTGLILEDLNLLDRILLYLTKADGEYTVFEYGFDLIFLNRNWQSDRS